jgi:hypothetical protein
MALEFIDNTLDTFPYIESTIRILDDNLNWWKANYKGFESKLSKAVGKISKEKVRVESLFIIYNGPEERNPDIKRATPAIKYTLNDLDLDQISQVADLIGGDWEGHIIEHHDDDIIVLFE